MPRPAQVLGLVGTNGIGKSTALKVLKGNLKPNLGQFDSPPTWEDILKHFRGSELQNYFKRVLEDRLKALIKPQYVDHIPKAAKGTVGPLLRAKDERKMCESMLIELQLDHVQTRDLEMLSGGELQRFAIAMVAVQEADVYMFDEPSSYLDVRQRLKAANVIRSLTGRVDAEDDDGALLVASGMGSEAKFVVVVEHDLAVLDYLSDFSASGGCGAARAARARTLSRPPQHKPVLPPPTVCVLYGTPGAYGVVTMPFSVREGINVFLAGFIPTENLRFREDSLSFRVVRGAARRRAPPCAAPH
jgi:ATP-binding cassette subfamily E protein 1